MVKLTEEGPRYRYSGSYSMENKQEVECYVVTYNIPRVLSRGIVDIT